MSDGKLVFPNWQAPLQELILEFDREELPKRIQQVECLIFERFQQIAVGNDSSDERQALNDALNVLRIIKRDKLAFPT